jgi:hypothetical protein
VASDLRPFWDPILCPQCGSQLVSALREADGTVRLVCRGVISGVSCLHMWRPDVEAPRQNSVLDKSR